MNHTFIGRYLLVLAALLVGAGCEVKMKSRTRPATKPVTTPSEPVRAEPVRAAPEPVPEPVAERAAEPVQPVEPVRPETVARLGDDELLEKVQRQTFAYFWDFGHPVSGLARERSGPGEMAPPLVPFDASFLTPAGGAEGERGLRGEYFDNTSFAGEPVLVRVDEKIDMRWGQSGPGHPVPYDRFSARWTGRLRVPETGDYDLGIGSDDGSWLYLDDKLVVDNGGYHGYAVEHKTVRLEAGRDYAVRIDFVENTGDAVMRFGRVAGENEVVPSEARVDSGGDCCAVGGSGFGIMATLVAAERGWITREQALERVSRIAKFLQKAERFKGAFPHWMNGRTGKAIPFTEKDDGGDLVETSYMIAGLLCARQYFSGAAVEEVQLRQAITALWEGVDWNWYTRGGEKVLFWHWSPKHQWAQNHRIGGWNECLITYVLAACSPTHPIHPSVYHEGWAHNGGIRSNREFHGIKLPLGGDYGGPLFFAHYTFMGLDPRGLSDRYADYWEQNVNHTLINRAHCVANARGFAGYGEKCWGLTASDNHKGYGAHSPTADIGVIAPTAALSSFPYTPEYSMQALRYFYEELGDRTWSRFGFIDAFSLQHDWYAKTHLAIDQGPIIVMIENHRTGLMWKLFMSIPEVQRGLKKLDFKSPHIK